MRVVVGGKLRGLNRGLKSLRWKREENGKEKKRGGGWIGGIIKQKRLAVEN